MHRILIPIDSQDPESWQYALAYAEKVSEQSSQLADVILLVHTKQQLDRTSLAGHIGTTAAKALSKGKSIQLRSGANLSVKTLKTVGQTYKRGIVIAFFADETLLNAVDDLRGLAGAIAVPDLPGDCDQWVARWNAIVHGQQQTAPTPLISDPVIDSALSSLIGMVNSTTGIGHPRDKQLADETLRILRSKNHTLDPEAIKSWAIQKGWRSDNASDLAKLASKVQSLKSKPSLSKIYNWQQRYESWSD